MSQIYGKHIDLLDDGDVYLQSSFKKVDYVSGYSNCYQAKAEAIVMGNWAHSLGVPGGTTIKGTLIVCYDQEGDPMDTPWEYYDFDADFEVIEISPQLVKDLPDAARDILDDIGKSKEDLVNPDVAMHVWSLAWQEVKAMPNWQGVTFENVTPGEVEALAYEKI